MANKNVELMRGNPEKAVKTLAIPIMISMLLTASYNIIDGIWVAGLGQAAIAGIGFVTPIFMILNSYTPCPKTETALRMVSTCVIDLYYVMAMRTGVKPSWKYWTVDAVFSK